MQLVLDEEFRNLVNTSVSKVGDELRRHMTKALPAESKCNFLKVVDSKKVSYLPKKKDEPVDKWDSPLRQVGKIATVINKLFPAKFSEDDIREFVEWYKSVLEVDNFEFHLTNGKGIGDVYRIPKAECSVFTKNGTTLHSACFQGNFAHPKDEVFIKNPDVIEMAYVTHNGKLDGRVLIVSGVDDNKNPQKFMTNLQFSHVTSRRMLTDYAKENNIVYRDAHYAWRLGDAAYRGGIRATIVPARGPGYLDNAVLGQDYISKSGY